jgi:hypothetical protein
VGGFTFNPVLSEIQSHLSAMSPDAQAAVRMANPSLPSAQATVAAQAPSVLPPGMLLPHPDAGPPPGNITMGSPAPTLSPSPMPNVEAPRGTVSGETNELGRLLDTGSGISQIGDKIQNSRLGEAHPLLGKLLGGLTQGAATIGDIGLRAGGGGIGELAEQMIPGTEGHHELLVNRENKQLNEATANAQKEAQAASENATAGKTNAETPEVAPNAESTRNLQGAEAEHAGAEAGAISRPQLEVHDTEEGPILVNRTTGTAQHVTVDGQPVGPKLKLTESQPIIDPTDNKPHTYMLDEKGNKKVDLGVHYERPQNVNVNAGDAAVDRLATRLAKPYQTAYDKSSAQLDNVDKTLRSIASGYKGQALALPETLTSLVSGQGTGVRVTMPELQMVGQHNGVKGDVESFFNRISGEGSMTDEDKKQLSGILTEMRGILQDKVAIQSGALDAINGAESREEIQQADKIARKQLTEYEKIGAMGDRAKHFGTVNGVKVMSEDGNHWQNIVTGEEVK